MYNKFYVTMKLRHPDDNISKDDLKEIVDLLRYHFDDCNIYDVEVDHSKDSSYVSFRIGTTDEVDKKYVYGAIESDLDVEGLDDRDIAVIESKSTSEDTVRKSNGKYYTEIIGYDFDLGEGFDSGIPEVEKEYGIKIKNITDKRHPRGAGGARYRISGNLDNLKKFIVDSGEDLDSYEFTPMSKKEDTIQKSNGKWTNRGKDGKEHGEFNTKKQADAQRKAMYANGYKGESVITEATDGQDYEIYYLTVDVAARTGDKGPLLFAGDKDRYRMIDDIRTVLRRYGYDLAGDYFSVEEGNTQIYKDSGDTFFDDDEWD